MLAAPAPAPGSGPNAGSGARSGPVPAPASSPPSSPAKSPVAPAPTLWKAGPLPSFPSFSSSAPASLPASAPASASPASSSATTVGGVDRAERKSENSGSRDDMVGRTLNKRYVVGDKVGEGGFGAVFRGKQLATGREVALKILHPYNLTDKTIVARFRREAEACSRLRNP
ncbi:MAG: hypothetical protein H7X95_13490, partial [Deltaproteobacteria bacterium]|nr:hypothetical protein [Deltaproteobacteria bacterium]